MRSKDVKMALILRDKEELDFFAGVFKALGYSELKLFDDSALAMEDALRHQYEMFILRLNMPGLSGLTFIQKIRSTGNYGMETILAIADGIDQEQFNLLSEYDIAYVLIKPFTTDRIVEKLKYLQKCEASLSDFEAKYREAKAALTCGIVDMAHQIAVELVEQSPDNDKALVLLGDVENKRGQLFTARRSYESALNLNSKSSAAAVKLAHTFVLEGDYVKAAAMTGALAELNPYNLRLLVDAGLSHNEIGDTTRAKDFARRVIDQDKESKEGREVLASAFIQEGDYQASCQILAESHSLKEQVGYYNNKGVELSRDKKYREAIAMYQMCLTQIKENPYLYVIHYNLGLAAIKAGDFALGQNHLGRSVQLNSEFDKAKVALERITKKGV